MKDVWLFLNCLLTAAAKLLGPGGVKGIIAGRALPQYVSSDHDPLFE